VNTDWSTDFTNKKMSTTVAPSPSNNSTQPNTNSILFRQARHGAVFGVVLHLFDTKRKTGSYGTWKTNLKPALGRAAAGACVFVVLENLWQHFIVKKIRVKIVIQFA